jgi:hypothetical protein
MADDRKYRQQGYRSQGRRDIDRRPDPPRPPANLPRGGGMLDSKTVSRCAACGAVLPIATSTLQECPHCRAALHTCAQCAHFDTSRRFECTQPVIARIADKNARNDCDGWTLRKTVERDASPDSTRPGDIRRGFDNLFKS